MQLEVLADYANVCGEGPLWHPEENAVYWTDIETGRLFRLDVATGEHETVYQGPRVGGFTIQADGSLLLFRDKGNIIKFKDGKLGDVIIEEIPGVGTGRFNDVFADPEGRVYCGTLGSENDRLFRLDKDGSLTLLLEGLGCSNGMGLTGDGKQLYFTDTKDRSIYVFDYNRATGEITNQRTFLDNTGGNGGPDGMTVDDEDHIWSAKWGGRCVERYSPDGKHVEDIEVPTPNVTCITFGGPNYDHVFITSAGGQDKEKNGPHAGALFGGKTKFKGRPEFRSKIRID